MNKVCDLKTIKNSCGLHIVCGQVSNGKSDDAERFAGVITLYKKDGDVDKILVTTLDNFKTKLKAIKYVEDFCRRVREAEECHLQQLLIDYIMAEIKDAVQLRTDVVEIQKSKIIITPEESDGGIAITFGARVDVGGECSFVITASGSCPLSSKGDAIAHGKRILRMIQQGEICVNPCK